MSDYTGKAIVDFLEYTANHGLMNRGTAGSLASAVRKVLEATHPDESWESVDVSKLDLDDTAQRFETLSRTQYKPESLQVYKSRFKNAVKMHSDWVNNPSGWRYKAERPSAARKRTAEEAPTRNGTQHTPQPGGATTVAVNDVGPTHEPADMVTYPYPLRPGLLVQIKLPPDLRASEAKRLAAFIESLVAEEQLALPSAERELDRAAIN